MDMHELDLGGTGLPPVGGVAYEFFVNRSNYARNALPRITYLSKTKITRPDLRPVGLFLALLGGFPSNKLCRDGVAHRPFCYPYDNMVNLYLQLQFTFKILC
jgi:hypothetical protein